ncbi:ATP-binding protein [Methylobacterium fujisawaense]|uniref:HD domain-containing protein n=1 Tax=Methylobacterium fujisawaense TaxID=107400 RepID=UPI0031F4E436
MSEASQTQLWQKSFVSKKGDVHQEARLRLVSSLGQMRDSVGTLLKNVPADCKDLTIHDVTHLDALWEMASLIVGEDYDLNPAEAYVLGGSILLHDAGLTVSSFGNGLADLIATTEWQDIAAAILREHSIEVNDNNIRTPPDRIAPIIKFAVLRALHAKQAEVMATQHWTMAGGVQIYIIDNLEFRQAFGSSIGRIAHSHNWDIGKVADRLNNNIGSGTTLPNEWSVNERKIACILRCADAAHIDRRRAPTILFAASRPGGLSARHWGAQNKINKPTVDKGTLIYSAGQSFRSDEAEAWWQAYDLIGVVDKEIRSSNALLEEMHAPLFKVQRVFGAESPRALSTYFIPDGWRPINAEVKVSDPVHLAKTLGGRQLYGAGMLAPLREILQNAADAIRARCKIEDRPLSWGQIKITLENDPDKPKGCILHVEDNGIGMTERVMAGPLIDFGKSIWSSSLLQEEFPGLQSKNIDPIGKFGIGFFSIFELGSDVKVVSKHYEAGLSDTKVLEFRSLSGRPLIRPALPKELPRDASTKISVAISDYDVFVRSAAKSHAAYRLTASIVPDLSKALLRMICMLDINVEFQDKVGGKTSAHSYDIYGVDADIFIEELLPDVPQNERDAYKAAYNKTLKPIVGEDGKKYGRAALSFIPSFGRQHERRATGHVGVGGFVYEDYSGITVPYLGVVEGSTDGAARRSARSSVPKDVLIKWVSEQAKLIDQSRFQKLHLMKAAESILEMGGNPGDLPYVFNQNKLITHSVLNILLSSMDVVHLPLEIKYSTDLKIRQYSELNANFFEIPMNSKVFVIFGDDFRLVNEDLVRSILKDGRREITLSDIEDSPSAKPSLKLFIDIVAKAWKNEPRLFVEGFQVFEGELHLHPNAQWVMSLRKGIAS